MPFYTRPYDSVHTPEELCLEIQASGEKIVHVEYLPGEIQVWTEVPEDTTGRPHLPSKETR